MQRLFTSDSKLAVKVFVDVTPGHALFLVGAHEKLGEWEKAIRMQWKKPGMWVTDIDPSILGTEVKFLKGPFNLGETASTSDLCWENGINRKLEATSYFDVFPHSFEERSKNSICKP